MRRSIASLTICLMVLMPSAAQSKDRYLDYPIANPTSYALHTTSEGLTVALEPVLDLEKLKTYFGIDLVRNGFVPVLIVVENHSELDSFFLLREDLRYALGEGGDRAILEEGQSTSGRSKTGSAVSAAGLLLVAIPAVFGGLALVKKASKVKQNAIKKEIRNQTLSPGAQAHGFVFVPVGKRFRDDPQLINLRVQLRPQGKGHPIGFDFVF